LHQGITDCLSLDGSLTAALVGTALRPLLGHWLLHSTDTGGGGYGGAGAISSTITGIFPYGRYALTPHLGIRATADYGALWRRQPLPHSR